ncbi:amino acid/amide ABC transporter substrate-binding protein, HAAT family [Kriegella aquimaris]|uniref:Amino acid/amide ABC transporter substrate-binding protein, HAAT family n=2 Tax=Kriegella aquimaris TaxID=192904 RepID=A0A1G9KEE8_9FLAO|nr:amino acid/amide ABC transporter substrate-binding protein, HAAT family [Kriegella aquimaris]
MEHIGLKMFVILTLLVSLIGCKESKSEEINIGYIGPLSKRATDLGIGPSNALQLAVDQYNASRSDDALKVNLFIEDDQWEKDNALPAYHKLRKEHDIDIVYISNTDGTIALQDAILKDQVILINPLNSDALLSSLNQNTFKIAKATEEANGLIAIRIIELGLKKVLVLTYPNDYMSRAATSCKSLLDNVGVENKVTLVGKDETDFKDELQTAKDAGVDAYVFFGYKEFGFAMKQARDLGIEAPFFGSTVLLDPEFFSNSEGTIIGTECSFFTPADGNYVLADEFMDSYKNKFGSSPVSVWPAMQAYDAMNMVLQEIANITETKNRNEAFDDWLRNRLFDISYYQGVCGNISIAEDGASRGIYFSLYQYASEGKLSKVRR